jgi:hypothetical protein
MGQMGIATEVTENTENPEASNMDPTINSFTRTVNLLAELAHPARIARRGARWMRNPGGKELFREHWVCFLKGRRDRSSAEKNRLKPACAREEPAPWSPKESPSPPGLGFPAKNWGWARLAEVRLLWRSVSILMTKNILI